MNLKPGCGAIITKQVGRHIVTLEFSSDVNESLRTRKKLVELMIENAKKVGHFELGEELTKCDEVLTNEPITKSI